jgi:hypothetical protein
VSLVAQNAWQRNGPGVHPGAEAEGSALGSVGQCDAAPAAPSPVSERMYCDS